MRVFDLIARTVGKIAEKFATASRLTRFDCGNCKRNEQCALAPSDECIVKAVQIACDDAQPLARAPAGHHPAVWPQ